MPSPTGEPKELVESDAPSHVDLVTLARALRRSAVTGDVTRVHHELTRLRNALVHHLHTEQNQFVHLPETTERVVHEGQRRLLALLDDLLFSTQDGDGSCTCIVRTAEVELMLRRQAKLETAVPYDIPSEPQPVTRRSSTAMTPAPASPTPPSAASIDPDEPIVEVR